MRQIALSLSLAGLAFIMTAIWGGPLLRILRHYKIGKIIRVDEPGHHGVKMGTPTMGGVMIILPVLLLTGLLNAVALVGVSQGGVGRSVLLPMVVMVVYAVLGAVDDWEGIRGKRKGEGMRAGTKFLFQVILALGTAYVLKYMTSRVYFLKLNLAGGMCRSRHSLLWLSPTRSTSQTGSTVSRV